jgi:uncharacterized cupin superfamily protein
MFNGKAVHDGAVAVSYANYDRLAGTRWRVVAVDDERVQFIVGKVFTVEDKGSRAHFDMWTGDCRQATQYGGHSITVEEVT